MVQTSKDGHLKEEPMAQPYLIEDFLVLTYQRDMRMRMDVLNMFPFSRWKRMWKSY